MKYCKWCNEEKSLEDFHKHSKMSSGYLNKCKTCVLKSVKEWRERHPNCRKEEHRKKGLRTREQYYAEKFPNPIGRKVSSLKYSYKRRRIQEKMFVSELDIFVFQEAKDLCDRRNAILGGRWEIDHIVPLFHKNACGLNSAYNFQVVPKIWNVRKGNRNMDKFIG